MAIRLILVVAAVSMITVGGLYVATFGVALSEDHTRWAEFGSFFGGVLGAAFAFLSILYLAYQIEMQRKENLQARSNLEMSQRESHISTCLSLLLIKLNAHDAQIRSPLAQLILSIHRDEKKMERLEQIKMGLSARGEALAIWVNIASALSYLKALNESRYLNQLTLVTVQLGQELCSALDNVVHLATGIKYEQHFSSR